MLKDFPIWTIAMAVAASFVTIWLQYPNVVPGDIAAMAAGQSVGVMLWTFAAYSFSYKMNSMLIEGERAEKASRVAWVALVVALIALARPLMPF